MNWWIDESRAEVYFSIDQVLSIVICPMPLTRVPNTHCNACLTVSELLRNDRHHDHHPDHHDHRDHLSHMKTSNFWSGLVKRQKSYLVIRCCVTKISFYALFAWSVTLASGRRRYTTCNDWYSNCVISVAKKIVQNFLQHFVLEPVLFTLSGTHTVWSYRKIQASGTKVMQICTPTLHSQIWRLSPRFPPHTRALPPTLRFCSLHVFML